MIDVYDYLPVLILCSVVDILELFEHPSEKLKTALQRHVDLFNPRDYCYTVHYTDMLCTVYCTSC